MHENGQLSYWKGKNLRGVIELLKNTEVEFFSTENGTNSKGQKLYKYVIFKIRLDDRIFEFEDIDGNRDRAL